jgi:hypothetical protein
MQNIITEEYRGKDVDYSFFNLMRVHLQVHRREHRVSHFITSYNAIRSNDVHDELQKDLIKEWWKWLANNSAYFICIFVHLLENNLF